MPIGRTHMANKYWGRRSVLIGSMYVSIEH
ncbi:hypothetical protein BTIS_0970 [Bifidobacterium tissieri]|uniref:Uncharacterized protein n=1 Tax=Bifidobacterium tissieri TaxID=1630162 RepID=A0A261FG56_9BIFI|nr:hypothetical protein BTIS_0970 [Bifidobacterium tissieri]